MRQLTLRKIPERVEEQLRLLAAKSQQSINKTAIKVLEKGLGIDGTKTKKRELGGFAGSWSIDDEEEFSRNVAMFDTIDDEVWQ